MTGLWQKILFSVLLWVTCELGVLLASVLRVPAAHMEEQTGVGAQKLPPRWCRGVGTAGTWLMVQGQCSLCRQIHEQTGPFEDLLTWHVGPTKLAIRAHPGALTTGSSNTAAP